MPNAGDIGWILPELVVLGSALLLLLWTAITRSDDRWGPTAMVVLSNAVGVLLIFLRQPADGVALEVFSGQLVIDGFSNFFRALFLAIASLAVVISTQRLERVPFIETAAMIQFSLGGMLLMVGAVDWVMALIALELMVVPVYVLTAMTRFRRRSVEAAMKYFVLGAFASAVLIYGIAWTYGLTGTTYLPEMARRLTASGNEPWVLFAVAMVLVAFGFKVAAVPFHAWTPDAYQGAPTPLVAFISVGPKIAAMALLARILTLAFEPLAANLSVAIAVIASATMILGNLAAIAQTDIKRMLGYSSIAHSGYMLVALAAVVESGDGMAFSGLPAVLFYGFVYAFMNFGAFAVAHVVEYQTGSSEISAFRGLARRAAIPALGMAIFMFSLTGIPPLSGFLGKLYILQSAVDADLGWLAILMVTTSVVSAFYYLRVVVNMFMVEPAEADAPGATGDGATSVITADTHSAVIAATAGVTLALGIIGGGLLVWAQSAVETGLL